MRGRSAALAAIACAWLAASACSGSLAGLRTGPAAQAVHGAIKVAIVDAFTGSPASPTVGTYLQNSVQYEVDQLDAHGGLLGAHVQVVTADDQYSLTATPGVVKQTLADPAVRLVVGPSYAGLYLGAKPLLEQAHVPSCVTSMDADDVMSGAQDTFREQEPAQARIPTLLSYIQRSTQFKKVGLIAEMDSVGQDADQQLSDGAPKAGLQYIGAAFTGTSADLRPQVQQMLQRGADVVILSENPTTAGRTLQAITQLKAGAKLHAFGLNALPVIGLGSYGFVQQVGDPANGLIFASGIEQYLSDVPDTRWPTAYRDFATAALSRFGPAANGVEMKALPAAAACVADWARAVQAADSLDGAAVAKAWESLDVPAAQSLLGVREQFSAADHDAVAPDSIFLYQWVHSGTRWSLKQLAGPGPIAAPTAAAGG